ncbi:MAG: tetratricopeptide repeat protein [Chloracidobacterium sp.]|nr:tetratricopeptide repeat protein [Chloracidobacterium sp.]MDW8217723.1 tetratricopeptide repeat protein [Acidobacteriota bacterium]
MAGRNGFVLVVLGVLLVGGGWLAETVWAQESNIERRMKGESKSEPKQAEPPEEVESPPSDKKTSGRPRATPPRKKVIPAASPVPLPKPPTAEAPPKPMDILVTVNVAQAEILVGEKVVGVARRDQPLKLQLPPGVIRLSAFSDNYLPFSQEVEIVPDTKRLEITLDYDIGALFARYENPRTTNLVTAEDWEAVVATANRHIESGDLRIEYRALGLLGQGQLALRVGDTASAIPRLLEATRLVPTSSVANYALGQAYLAAGQIAEAAAAFQRAIATNPVLAMAHYGLGVARLRQGQPREAVASLERAEALGYAPPELALQIARALVAQRSYSAAIARLQPLMLSPSVEVLVTLGDAYAGQKKNTAAREAYETAMLRDPASPLPLARLGEMLFRAKQYKEARHYLQQAVELDPDGRLVNTTELRTMLRKTLGKGK